MTKKKKKNDEIFQDYIGYYTPLFLVKDLFTANQTKNEKIVNLVNHALITLWNTVKRK